MHPDSVTILFLWQESFLSYGKDVLSRAKSIKKKKQWRSPAVNQSNKIYGCVHANWDEF